MRRRFNNEVLLIEEQKARVRELIAEKYVGIPQDVLDKVCDKTIDVFMTRAMRRLANDMMEGFTLERVCGCLPRRNPFPRITLGLYTKLVVFAIVGLATVWVILIVSLTDPRTTWIEGGLNRTVNGETLLTVTFGLLIAFYTHSIISNFAIVDPWVDVMNYFGLFFLWFMICIFSVWWPLLVVALIMVAFNLVSWLAHIVIIALFSCIFSARGSQGAQQQGRLNTSQRLQEQRHILTKAKVELVVQGLEDTEAWSRTEAGGNSSMPRPQSSAGHLAPPLPRNENRLSGSFNREMPLVHGRGSVDNRQAAGAPAQPQSTSHKSTLSAPPGAPAAPAAHTPAAHSPAELRISLARREEALSDVLATFLLISTWYLTFLFVFLATAGSFKIHFCPKRDVFEEAKYAFAFVNALPVTGFLIKSIFGDPPKDDELEERVETLEFKMALLESAGNPHDVPPRPRDPDQGSKAIKVPTWLKVLILVLAFFGFFVAIAVENYFHYKEDPPLRASARPRLPADALFLHLHRLGPRQQGEMKENEIIVMIVII